MPRHRVPRRNGEARVSDIRLDWGTVRAIPDIAAALRGGDDHLLSGVSRIFERHGFRVVGIQDVAPELLMPEGSLTRLTPDADAMADIAKGRDLMRALGPFDVGQAVVVIDGHVVAVEDIEGTDALLTRVARLRDEKRIRAKASRGVWSKRRRPVRTCVSICRHSARRPLTGSPRLALPASGPLPDTRSSPKPM